VLRSSPRKSLIGSEAGSDPSSELDTPRIASAALTTEVSVDLAHKFVFVCGLHRSGTSPLFRILREHPEISGFRNTNVFEDEGQHLQTVFPAANIHSGVGRFGWSPEAHLIESSGFVTRDNRQRLIEEWSRYWDLSKTYLLEKSPPNLIRTRFLQAMFPHSYFVVITRQPIAVSLATWKWTRISLEDLLRHWLYCHQVFAEDQGHLRRVLVIKYEELIADTANMIEKVHGFLGVRSRAVEPMNRDGNERYFRAWRELQKKLPALTRHLIARYEREVRGQGYSLVNLEPEIATT
jgi:Sulfotransferase family